MIESKSESNCQMINRKETNNENQGQKRRGTSGVLLEV